MPSRPAGEHRLARRRVWQHRSESRQRRRRRPPAATTAAQAATTAAGATTAAAADHGRRAKELAKAPGFDGKTIKVGVITALSGAAAVIGKQLAAGQDVFWKYYNAEKGGIAGKYPVEVVLEDSLYESNTTVQKYNKIKGDVVMLSQVMGTAATLALLPLLKADNVVAAPASQDALWVREQNLFPIIEPYQIDAINAMDYMMKEGGAQGKNVCAVLQNDVYGEAGLEGLQFAGTKLGFELKATPRYKLGDQDFTAQVNELKNAKCDVVFAVSLPTEFGKILGTAAGLGFAPQWVGQSPAWVDALLATPLKDYMAKNVMIAAVGPQWGDPSVPAAVEFADAGQAVQARPAAELLLLVRLLPGAGHRAAAREGRCHGQPRPCWDRCGHELARQADLRRLGRRLWLRDSRPARPGQGHHHVQGEPHGAVRPGVAQVQLRLRCRQGLRVLQRGGLSRTRRLR